MVLKKIFLFGKDTYVASRVRNLVTTSCGGWQYVAQKWHQIDANRINVAFF